MFGRTRVQHILCFLSFVGETKMKNLLVAICVCTIGGLVVASPSSAGAEPAKPEVLCKDCPFPMTIVCAQPEARAAGHEPFPLKCRMEQKQASQPFKILQCEFVGGGDGDPFPSSCTLK
jgi:hypothetical protein